LRQQRLQNSNGSPLAPGALAPGAVACNSLLESYNAMGGPDRLDDGRNKSTSSATPYERAESFVLLACTCDP
jgi:hypothetical protein